MKIYPAICCLLSYESLIESLIKAHPKPHCSSPIALGFCHGY